MLRLAAVPVILVPTKVVGVPKLGVVKVGLVAKTAYPEPVAVFVPVPPEETAKGVVKVTTPLAIVMAVPVPPTKAKVPDVSELITSEVAVVVPAVNIVAILGS